MNQRRRQHSRARLQGLTALVSTAALALGAHGTSRGDHPFETDALREPSFRTGGSCVIHDVVIHPAVPGRTPFRGSVLVRDGIIDAIGDVTAPEGVHVIQGEGRHLTPGAIDAHSHMAIDRGINESTLSITADVDIGDTINAEDVSIYRALAGGVTSAHIMHGSANAIGGRGEIIKCKWGRTADEIRFDQGTPQPIKFALGENPKRSNGGRAGSRFPDTRMGVEAIFYRAFSRAGEYQAEWAEYRAAQDRGEDPAPPRRDLRLDVLTGILEGTVDVHSHSYRADEIVMLMRAAEHFGFRVKTLHHVLEGYKVAQEIAAHGAGGSTFGDWWAYKIEAYDAIPQNAGLMTEAGVNVSLKSDSNEMMRRLFGEAAKSVRYYPEMSREDALLLITLNPAQQLGIDDRVGSIEEGKHADLVLHTGDPLSSLSRVEWTMVDGEIEFTRIDAFGLDAEPPSVAVIESSGGEAAWDPDGGETLALVSGTVHTVSGGSIPGGTVLIQDGILVGVGKDLEIPAGARVVDLSGKHLWPGQVALHTGLGLWEIGSVRGTDDLSEIGGNQPDIRVSSSLNAESAHIGVTRFNGVTRAQSAPQGGGPMMGQSALIRLAGETWEELLHVDRDMLHVSFPRTPNTADEKDERDAVTEMRKLLGEARAYGELLADAEEHGTPRPAHDSRLEALQPYIRGEKPVAMHCSNAQTILRAVQFAEEEGLKPLLMGGREAWKVADILAAKDVPVVVGPVLALPTSRFDPYDSAYANAAVLSRAGVRFAIMPGDNENPRNLAFHGAMASAFGLPREEALRAITLYPAQLLGVGNQLGSLEVGKVADVVVTDGDLLEISSRVEQVFIDGVRASMRNRQNELYGRYRDRLHRLMGTGDNR